MPAKQNGENGDGRDRKCLNGLSADTPVKAPHDGEFGIDRYLKSDDLLAIINAAIRTERLGLGDILAAECAMGARWAKTLGKSRGKAVLSKLIRCSGALGFETGLDYIVYLAADQARELGLTHWQLEAAIYHELRSIQITVDSDNNTTMATRAPDVVLFIDELEHYGPWMIEHAAAREAFRQAPLFGDVVATFDRQRAAAEKAATAETS